MKNRPDQTKPIYQGPFTYIDGDISFGEDVTVWPGAVIRTESEPIVIGDRTNIQDGCVLHTDEGYPIQIGNDVTIGHRAIIHGAAIEDGALIGMGAIVMNGAKIGKHAMVGAGALVSEGKEIPDGALAIGVPAKVVRLLSEDEQKSTLESAARYVEAGRAKAKSE